MDRVCQNAGRPDPGTSTAPDSYLAGDWSEAGPAGIRHKRGPRMSGTVIDRELPSAEAVDLLDLTRDLVTRELVPRADEAEAAHSFPRELIAHLGELGLLSLPYPEEFGGGGQPAVV